MALGSRHRTTGGPAQTEALGARLARELRPGDVVLVEGDLGAGKSTLVRGALRALGVTGPIASPTFTLGRAYAGTPPVSHLDLYRLGEPGVAQDAEADEVLLEPYLDPGSIAFVEWPEHAPGRLLERPVRRVRLEHRGGDEREVELE